MIKPGQNNRFIMQHLQKFFRFFYILTALGVMHCSSVFAYPELGDNASINMNQTRIDLLSRKALFRISQKTPLVHDPMVLTYINRLGRYLLRYSSNAQTNIRFVVLQSDDVNAFALPANIIGVNTQLILHARKEGELASVMAHEIAHVNQKHFIRTLAKRKNNNVVSIASLIGSVLLAIASPQAAQAAYTATIAGQKQAQIGYIRQHEYEADRIGVNTLTKAGYAASDMASFFKRLPKGTYHQKIYEPLMTHPLHTKRFGEAMNRQQSKQNSPSPSYAQKAFKFIQARTKILTHKKPQKILEKINQLPPNKHNKPANIYTRSVIYSQMNQFKQALKSIGKLTSQLPESLIVQAARCRILLKADKLQKARQCIDNVNAIHWQSYAAQMLKLKLYQKQNQTNKAKWLLQDIIDAHPQYAPAYNQLANLLSQQGKESLAHFYKAKYHFQMGNLYAALVQYELAFSQLNRHNPYRNQAKRKKDLLSQNLDNRKR